MIHSKARRRLGIVSAVIFAALIGFAAEAGNILVGDRPERAEVIVVLAGETEHRPEKGMELLNEGYGLRVLLDVPAHEKMFGFSEVELAKEYESRLPRAASLS